VSCFYGGGGKSKSGYDQAEILRQEVLQQAASIHATRYAATENDGKNEKQEDNGCETSLCLVLSAPWGAALAERYWRLMTIRRVRVSSASTGKTGELIACRSTGELIATTCTMFIDSESVLTSSMRPPSVRGSSVLNNLDTQTTLDKLVTVFKNQFRAQEVNINPKRFKFDDTSAETEPLLSSPSTAANSPQTTVNDDIGGGGDGADLALEKRAKSAIKQVEVLKALLQQLRKENGDMRVSLEQSRTQFEDELTRRSQANFSKERHVLYTDIEKLTCSNEASANEASIERVRASVALAEVTNAEQELKQVQNSVQTLRGDHLVLEEQFSELRKTTRIQLDEYTKLQQLCKVAQADARRTRTESSQQQLTDRAKTDTLESKFESQRSEIEKLNAALYELREKADSAKTTAAEQLSKLVDSNQELLLAKENVEVLLESYKIESQNEKKKSMPVLALACKHIRAQQRATNHVVLRFVAELRLRVERGKVWHAQEAQRVAEAAAAEAATAVEALQIPQPVVYAADAVAAAKSCVALLNAFVEKSQNQSSSSSTLPPPPSPHSPHSPHSPPLQPPSQQPTQQQQSQPPPLPPQQQPLQIPQQPQQPLQSPPQQQYFYEDPSVGYHQPQYYYVPNGHHMHGNYYNSHHGY
jgi:hypothetical protein